MALAIVGYLSPLTLWLKPAAPPSRVSLPNLPFKRSDAIVATPPHSPPPPQWRYEKPVAFDKAEAQAITLLSRSRFGPVDADSTIAISDDGLRLACCRGSNDATLVVYDLETLEDISVSLPQKPTALTWSPDAKRVLLVGGSDQPKLWVFETETRRWLLLPKPVDDWLPPGRPIWWQKEEVFFAGYKPRVLDLATLRALKMDVSSKWKGMSDNEKAELQSSVRLPRNARWEMRVEADLQKYEVPADTTAPWRSHETPRLAFGHPQTGYRLFPPGIAASDGTKVIRVRNDSADIFYFGVSPALANRVEITMPASQPDSLSSALTENRICAFVCAPMINPLNGKTVGPDRMQVKALVRMASWVGTAGEFWIEEDYRPLQSGDVLADLHLWEKHAARAAGDFADQEWFTVLGKLEPDNKMPGLANVKALDRAMDVVLDNRRDAIRVTGFTQRSAGKTDTPTTKTPPQSETTGPPASTARTPTINVQESRASIVSFIVEHHGKASRGNVAGLAADYAMRVEFMNHGVVGSDFIRRDISAYHAPGTRTTESVEGTIGLRALAIEQVATTYSYSFFHQGVDGKWIRGLADMAINLQPTTQGWKITEQHVKIRQKQEGP